MVKKFDRFADRYPSKIIGQIDGKKKSIAEKMANFILKKSKEYPFRNKYKMYPGPNSNTYTQWVLNYFPNSGLKLPINAFGKNWKQ